MPKLVLLLGAILVLALRVEAALLFNSSEPCDVKNLTTSTWQNPMASRGAAVRAATGITRPCDYPSGVWTRSNIIPYVITGTFNAQQLSNIKRGIEYYNRHTCVRFVERTNQADYFDIVNDEEGCAYVAYVGHNPVRLGLSFGCSNGETQDEPMIHELYHVLQYGHDQSPSMDGKKEGKDLFWDGISSPEKMVHWRLVERSQNRFDVRLNTVALARIRCRYRCYGGTSLL